MESADVLLTADHNELDRLYLQTLEALDQGGAAETFGRLDLFWARLAVHIRAEHLRLFPAVLELADSARTKAGSSADLSAVIDELHRDHDFFMLELARAIKAMRLVFYFGNEAETFIVVRGILERVRSRLEEHNRIEEELIYPMAGADVIGNDAAAELAVKVRKQVENLPPRFRV